MIEQTTPVGGGSVPDRQLDRILAVLSAPPLHGRQEHAEALALLESALGWDWPRLADQLDQINDLLADIHDEDTVLATAADALRDIAEAGVALLDLYNLRGPDAPPIPEEAR